MHLTTFALTTVSLGKVAFGNVLPNQEPLQRPIVLPHDNFNLTPIRDALISNKVIGDVLDDFEPTYRLDILYPKHDVHVDLGNEIDPKLVKERPNLSITPISDGSEPPIAALEESLAFTVILTDPDAKSRYRPQWSEMCHWIVTNITTSPLSADATWSLGPESQLDDVDGKQQQQRHGSFPSILRHKNHRMDRRKHRNHHRKGPRPNECKKDRKGGKCLAGELESYFAPNPPAKTGWHRYVFVLLQGNTTSLTAPTRRRHWGYGLPRHGVKQWAAQNGLEIVGANFFFAENEKQFFDWDWP